MVEWCFLVVGCTGVVSSNCISHLQRIPEFSNKLFFYNSKGSHYWNCSCLTMYQYNLMNTILCTCTWFCSLVCTTVCTCKDIIETIIDKWETYTYEPSVACNHKTGYQMIPMWAWQGKKKKKGLYTTTNKTTTTDMHKVKLQVLSRAQPLSAVPCRSSHMWPRAIQ